MNLYISFALFLAFLYTLKYSRYIYTNLLLSSLYFVATVFYQVADYFTNKGVDEAVVYHLQVGLDGAGFGAYKTLISLTILSIVLFIFLAIFYIKKLSKTVKKNNKIALLGLLLAILSFLLHPLVKNIYDIYKNMTYKSSNDFNRYYKTINNRQKGDGLNLVYIYAESLERTYMDEKLFPNLVQNLRKLQNRSDNFTNINQVINTGWTIAGVVATQCGLPLFVNSAGNTVNANSMQGSNSFLRDAVCLGDVLKNDGYYLEEMQGSSVNFSGIKEFYKSHSFDKVRGRDDLELFLKDKNYLNGWGLYDDSLLKLVYKRFVELSKSGKKFALFFATMDTHHPDGQLSKSCKHLYNDGKNSILNCVKCSDSMLSKFIEKIQNSKYAKKTLIVITSDHLAMRNSAYETLLKGKRRDLFLIFDSNEKKFRQINKAGSMLDVGSTILYKLGIKGDIGLGRNLYKEDSLYSKFKNFDKKLLSWGEDIFSLWGFANIKTQKSYKVDIDKKELFIAKEHFRLPLLIKINDDDTIKPIFEFNSPKKLYSQLKDFKKSDKFIWVDKCSRINFVFDKNFKDSYCLAQGFMSAPFEIYGVKKSRDFSLDIFKEKPDYKRVWTYDISQWKLSVLEHMAFNSSMGIYIFMPSLSYHASLKEGIDFQKRYYPDFIKAVIGLGTAQNGGRWSGDSFGKNILFIFKKSLPQDFTLKLKLSVKPANIGKTLEIKIADKSKKIVLKKDSSYSINFQDIHSDTIEFLPLNFDKKEPKKIKFIKLELLD
jgi:phosphoglycerol transferase